jgi:hypothetical protein
VAEIAALPVQDEKRTLWRKLNARKPLRPMVMIDQVCWNEFNGGGDLTLRCTDKECRGYEDFLRRTLYQWKNFPVDMVVEPFIRVGKAVLNTGFGITVHAEKAVTDPTSSIIGRKFENQIQTEADLEKIKMPRISHDSAETERRLAVAHELFDGILEVRPWGMEIFPSLWDPISAWMSVEGALYALIDQPEMMHKLAQRMTDNYMGLFDQLEQQGLLCQPQGIIHCTGAYTDELPAPGYNPEKPRTKDIWMAGLAQMFSTVSPAMFQEFEIDYVSRICARFGLVYYGCCEPLDGKMKEVRMLPKVRKISMSPWTNEERGAAEIGRDYVFSRKPNPAIFAGTVFDPERVRKELLTTRKVCEKNGCPLEIIMKDISTVCYKPERLFDWARIAMQIVGG